MKAGLMNAQRLMYHLEIKSSAGHLYPPTTPPPTRQPASPPPVCVSRQCFDTTLEEKLSASEDEDLLKNKVLCEGGGGWRAAN